MALQKTLLYKDYIQHINLQSHSCQIMSIKVCKNINDETLYTKITLLCNNNRYTYIPQKNFLARSFTMGQININQWICEDSVKTLALNHLKYFQPNPNPLYNIYIPCYQIASLSFLILCFKYINSYSIQRQKKSYLYQTWLSVC